ncbi:hypothetical protein ACMD2_06244 [Ananas comosus]|uniref:Uncharacterized protein n=1 Tax=Ananas comosus TaxID=4615 RepID=A0A199VZ96_ANACO|nr:hypothetical protein ACMD2_06244 [Ananas comosus]
MRKHLSAIANDVLQRCAQGADLKLFRTLDASVDALAAEFEMSFKPGVDNYSRRLVEFCSLKALEILSSDLGEKITDGSFSRFTYDMMLAWERPSAPLTDEEPHSESIAKEKEDTKEPLQVNEGDMEDDISLFYSDIMPLLVNEEPSIGEDAYLWFGSILPLPSDVVNARFTFETLTASTAHRLHFPAYDKFLKEIDKCVRYLQKQSTPTGCQLAEDEFILHVEGTARTQRVVRHIGASSWPGRLSLTNKALYFEASGVISYEPALKVDLSKAGVDHQVKAASTGPWGAPLFDKAIVYESSQLSEPLVLEFPEMTSSTRRDHWLTLVKEVTLLHHFVSKFNIESAVQAWEVNSRTTLGVLRLHAAREMLRISPPAPTNFLIFTLYEDQPKGDYVLEQLANSVKLTTKITPRSATSILKSLNMSHPIAASIEMKEGFEEQARSHADSLAALEMTIDQGLLSPLKNMLNWIQSTISWERPPITIIILAMTLVIIYKEWVGYALAAFLMAGDGVMLWARWKRIGERCGEMVVDTSTDKTTMESIVEAQHGLKNLQELVKKANITILKLWSVMVSRAPKHTNAAMLAMAGFAILLGAVPFKYILMGLTLYCFVANSMVVKSKPSSQGNRRLREWWESIPIIPVRTVANPVAKWKQPRAGGAQIRDVCAYTAVRILWIRNGLVKLLVLLDYHYDLHVHWNSKTELILLLTYNG